MKVLVAAIVFASLVSIGVGLRCFACNSHEDPDCTALPFDVRNKYVKECSGPHNYTICRKLHMFMDQDFGTAHPSEDRVHRDCGYVQDDNPRKKGDCYYKSGYNTRTWVCSCEMDECNVAPLAGPMFIPILVELMGVLLQFRAN